MTRRAILAFTLPALLLAACPAPSTPTKPQATTKPTAIAGKPGAKPAPTKAESLAGTAVAPAGIVAAGGGNYVGPNGASIVAAGGGNMVAAGAGNMVAAGAGNYALLAVDEAPLAGAAVYLVPADEKGVVPDRDPDAIADEKGAFLLPVPEKSKTGAYAVVVSAKNEAGKAAPMSTVVEADPKGKATKVGAATTMVTALLRKRGASAFAGFQLAQFDGLVALMAQNLDAANLPDFSDPEAVAAKADEVGKKLDAFGKALDGWGAALQKDPTSILNGNLPAIPGFPLK